MLGRKTAERLLARSRMPSNHRTQLILKTLMMSDSFDSHPMRNKRPDYCPHSLEISRVKMRNHSDKVQQPVTRSTLK